MDCCWWRRRATTAWRSSIRRGQGACVSVAEGGTTGHEVTASPDGRFAYVPIYGNSGVGKPGTDGSNMVVIDIAAHKVVGNVDFGHGVRPHHPVFGPKDGLLYVTTELDKTVSIIDPRTLKIVGSVPTGQPESHMLALSHDGAADTPPTSGRERSRCSTWRRAKP